MVTAGPLGFLLVALPLLLAVGPKGCPIDVQCGDVLDIDYGQYRLNGDLECPFGGPFAPFSAVTITGERVHFNLAGYTITRDDGSGVFLQQGILVRGANAHVNNGSIVDINCPGWNNPDCAAIRLGEAPGARINGMSLHNNAAGITHSHLSVSLATPTGRASMGTTSRGTSSMGSVSSARPKAP
jgi:hypothetical protein